MCAFTRVRFFQADELVLAQLEFQKPESNTIIREAGNIREAGKQTQLLFGKSYASVARSKQVGGKEISISVFMLEKEIQSCSCLLAKVAC